MLLFALLAQGCKRTSKKELIDMRIIQKLEDEATQDGNQRMVKVKETRLSRFSRPGSSYILATQSLSQKPQGKVTLTASNA